MGIIRLLLALSVDLGHMPIADFAYKMVDGGVAVQAFFMISGFYMALVLSTKYAGPGGRRLFYIGRFLKIFPVYWIALAAALLLFYNTTGRSLPLPTLALPTDGMLFSAISQIALFGIDWTLFLNVENGHIVFVTDFWSSSMQLLSALLIPQAWSIGLELDFYLLAPLLNRLRSRYLLLIIAASIAIRYATYDLVGFRDDPWTGRFFPSELAFFVAGMISYRIYALTKGWFGDPSRVWLVRAGVLVAVVATIAYQLSPLRSRLTADAYPDLILVLLPLLTVFTSEVKIDRRIGELSYPVYIFHNFVNQLLLTLMPGLSGAPLYPVYAILAVIVVAALVNEALEPFLDMARRRASSIVATRVAAVS